MYCKTKFKLKYDGSHYVEHAARALGGVGSTVGFACDTAVPVVSNGYKSFKKVLSFKR